MSRTIPRPPASDDVEQSTPDRVARLLDALHALAPLIAEHRAAFDRDRRIPDAVFAALADAGLFRLWLPRAFGGVELSPVGFMEVVEAAAALDGSIGWLAGNGGGMSRVAGYLPADTARAWFASQRCFVVSATGAVGHAAPVVGGWRLTGRWSFGSGAPHATHFMVLATEDGGTTPDRPRLCCYVPREQVTVHDTWHVSGLRGTGSCDFEITDAFVPIEHAHPLLGHSPSQPGLLYRLPPLSVFAWTVTVVPLGIARGAIDAFVRQAGAKSRLGSQGDLRDRESIQATVGRAEILHRAARGLLIETMGALCDAVDAPGDRLLRARADLRAAGAFAGETAVRIVDMLVNAAGAATIFESNPLERANRDVLAAVKHVAMNVSSYGVRGRLSLGLDIGGARL